MVPCLAAILLLTGAINSLLHAQISEEDKKKRDAFLKAREEMHTIPTATPSKSASPAAKPKPAKKKPKSGKSSSTEKDEPEPKKTPSPKIRTPSDDDEDEEPAKRNGKKATPSPTASPRATPKQADEDDVDVATPRSKRTPVPTPRSDDTPPPRAARTVAPAPAVSVAPGVAQPPADITIQKSGFEAEQGYEPPPPPPRRRGFFSRLFGGGEGRTRSYRYLNSNVIEAIRRAPVQRSRWKFIIVHNSGTRQGSARAFDYYHRNVRRMKNGMAYHFVVGNGTSTGDGQIEIGNRWRRQINGGHVHSDYLNNISLGICLVGDFNRSQPTKAQLDATEELIKYLRERCGKVDGRPMGVRPHREMNPPRWATDCPGDAFPYGWFRRF
ncbi:hypothetical protein BH18VER1_BH18VER1_03970 [soil metagenome]